MRRRNQVACLLALVATGCAHTHDTLPKRASLPAATTPLCGYRLSDDKSSLVFVYLHGGPGYRSADFVRSVGPLLAAEGTVIAFDQRGSGCSERGGPPSRFTIDAQVADVAELIQKNAGRPVILIGHSYGGLLAAHVAEAHPELVSGLVLLDAPLDLDRAVGTLIDRCAAQARDGGRAADADALEAARKEPDILERIHVIGKHAPQCPGELLVPKGNHPTEAETGAADRRDYAPAELQNDGALLGQVFAEWPDKLRLAPDALKKLPMPVVAIWGDKDPYYPAPEEQDVSTVVVPGAGHHSYREHPAQVAAAILELARKTTTK